jgi:hypothetical protein
MVRQRKDNKTMDLLNWQPPAIVRSFPPDKIRAASLRALIAKATAAALKECGRPRAESAALMSDWLGEPCSENMLHTFASEGREDHVPSLVRFLGIAHATGDAQRLLQVLADQFDLAVIPTKYVGAIEDAIIADTIEDLKQRQQLARKGWKGPR